MTNHIKQASTNFSDLPDLIYLHQLTGNKVPPEFEIQQIPFPPSKLKFISTDDWILECVEKRYYLRNLTESLIVKPIEIDFHRFDQNDFIATGKKIEISWTVVFLTVKIFNEKFVVAWRRTKNSLVTFLPTTRFECPFKELPIELQFAYRRADMDTEDYASNAYLKYALAPSKKCVPKAIFNADLFLEEEALQIQGQKILDAHGENIDRSMHSAKGPWEESISHDIFEGNPNLMTDDEFEMIYGRPR